jgi:hypothetical protein
MNAVMNLCVEKQGEFLAQLRTNQLHKDNSAPCTQYTYCSYMWCTAFCNLEKLHCRY